MSDDIKYTNNRGRGKSVAGVIILVVGLLLLVKQFDLFFFPHWLFSFPMAIIAVGFFIGAKNNFRNIASIILIIIGTAFLLDDIIPGFDASNLIWPIMIIFVGIWLILKRNKKGANRKHFNEDKWNSYGFGTSQQPAEPIVDYTVNPTATPPPADPGAPKFTANIEDEPLALSIFGGVKKTILSKDFKGGELVIVFGGVELDFTQADISGPTVIDITQVFGGIKIIVPANWKVVSDLAAVFASVDDKRIRTTAPVDSDKVLILKGISFFAGVDVRSY
jgi:predicted membrane protein